ncbi:MAG: aminotransferase class I/II-fold pyridoxal phosphate-dependent enzyme [Deltaproteobacteria bacterium]|nr:aminotransferase class I/II-fold pyridoxal phosphate-dependent enzyme [Deltaproteobacteria bacterium]MBW2123170.1 aminotransferase class I/II-fold pyridoxal phosphate-dependent enzyme [Deltaproteobacteria bacterium]
MKTAKRLETFEAYLGTAMNVILTRMKKEGKDVINLGLGDPDVVPPEGQRKALADACMKATNHHYPSFYSSMPLKEAISGWYKRRFGVECDPETEVLPLLGSAEGLFHINTCLLDVGDTALVPDPCYPAYVAGARIAGGVMESVPLLKENGFVPDLDSIDPEIARRARMIWVNYPNNPTAAVAPDEFYTKLIDWANRYEVAVIADNPYSEVCFEDYRPPSFLQFDGAKEVGVELNSLSKSYNCCGWRVGMMLGNREIIEGVNKIKSHSDRGIFYPLQVAAAAALNGPTDFMRERNLMYQERRDAVIKGLRDVGLEAMVPKATFYVWSSIPKGATSRDFCFRALEEANIWMIPGSMYGKFGEGYLRIALTHPLDRLEEAMDRLKKFMS